MNEVMSSKHEMCVRLLTERDLDPACKVFALVDGSLLNQVLPKSTRLDWTALQFHSLLQRTNSVAENAGPLLFELNDDHLNANLPGTLLDVSAGVAAGSFIVTKLTANKLTGQLVHFVNVQMHDGTEMVMRFFDPRVLPFWFSQIGLNSQLYVTCDVSHWLYWDRGLQLQALSIQKNSPAVDEMSEPVCLTVAQEDRLLSDCYPFTMVERFRKEAPEKLNLLPISTRYQFFRNQIERAHAHGLQSHSDIETYCGLALDVGTDFDQDPAVLVALGSVAKGEAFTGAISKITDTEWRRIRESVCG
jgi:Domain of unknown function (DUF4123)